MSSSTDPINFSAGGSEEERGQLLAPKEKRLAGEQESNAQASATQETFQALRDSEERLRLAIQAGNIYTWEIDVATRKVIYSPNVKEVMGFSLHDNPSDDREFVHPDDRAFIADHYLRALRGEADYNAEHRFINPETGEVVWVRAQGLLIHDEQRNRLRLVGITQNITEHKRSKESLATLHAQLEAELASIQRLHEVSTQLRLEDEPDKLLEKILDAAIEITGADMGNIQFLDPVTRKLQLRCQRGFESSFLTFFDEVDLDSPLCCAEAVRNGRRTVVPDVYTSTLFSQKMLDVLMQADVRSVQSTPLVTREGEMLGALSTHWRHVHMPDDRELRMLDLLAHEAADLIERSHAKESLRQRAEEFQAHFNLTSVGNTQADVESGRLLLVNRAFCDLLGYSEAELLGRTIWEVTDPADVEANRELFSELVREERTAFDLEKRLLHKDGTTRWVLVSVTIAQRSSDGKPLRTGAVVLDITERKKAEEELRQLNEMLERRVEERTMQVRQSEARFRALVDASAQIVWTTDAQGRVIEDSPSWRSFTGQTYDEGKEWGWMNAIHPEDHEQTIQRWRRATAHMSPMDTEFRVQHVDGEWHWMQVRAVPLRSEKGAVQGWVGMNIDINERKKAEADRERLARSLMMAEQEERRRISQILHDDLQQLLYATYMRIGMIRQDLDAAGHAELIGGVEEVSAWLKQCVETTRQMTVDLSPPILKNEGLADALEWLQSQMERLYGLKILIDVQERFLVPDQDLRALLFQVSRELLFNVAKHAGVKHVLVKLGLDNGYIVIQVIDEGQGFDIKRISEREDHRGGFGLSSVQERLRLVGGRMEIRSRPGAGTHAVVQVPMHVELLP